MTSPLTHSLLSARCEDDLALLETAISNGDNPLAAFAFHFEVISAKFCDELAAFTSGFGRLQGFAQPPGVFVKIH